MTIMLHIHQNMITKIPRSLEQGHGKKLPGIPATLKRKSRGARERESDAKHATLWLVE